MGGGDKILVYGATGLTGGLVVDALLARGVQPMIGARSKSKLRAFATSRRMDTDSMVVADASQPFDVAQMVERARVVVSCAGPFMAVGEPTVAACAARGVFYTDSTGEAPFVQMIARRYESSARAQQCALAPAMAFEVAVADAAAACAAQGLEGELDVELAYGITDGVSSRGTRASTAWVLGEGSLYYENGELRSESLAAQMRSISFLAPMGMQPAVSFPSPEIITVPRHVKARSVRVFMHLPRAELLHRFGRAVAPIAAIATPVLSRLLATTGKDAPSRQALAATKFQVVARAREIGDDANSRTVIVTGSDPYSLSGALLAEAAIAMSRGTVSARGLAAPSQVLGFEQIFGLVKGFGGGSVTISEGWS